jgi:hypothetical protein
LPWGRGDENDDSFRTSVVLFDDVIAIRSDDVIHGSSSIPPTFNTECQKTMVGMFEQTLHQTAAILEITKRWHCRQVLPTGGGGVRGLSVDAHSFVDLLTECHFLSTEIDSILSFSPAPRKRKGRICCLLA